MDLAAYYDAYWRQADDTFDHERLALLAKHVRVGDKVLEVDCGPGVLAVKMGECGADVVATDLSSVAVARAQAKGIPCTQIDIDTEALPWRDDSFDVVVSNSAIEHRFFHERAFDECIRVLKPGGRFVVCLPNIAHLICRWWVLTGRFPYLANAPTDVMHLRFFTVHEATELCRARGLEVLSAEGSASLWAHEFYPALWRKHRLRRVIGWLARVWPAMFGRDFVLLGVKQHGRDASRPSPNAS